jgi:nucleotide-binding universal stress UspA family protein
MFKKVLLAVDLGDPESWAAALPAALDLARQSGGTLHVLTVAPEVSPRISNFFPSDANRDIVARTADELRDFVAKHVPADVPVQDIVAQGGIHHEVLAAAEQIDADVVVMGSHRPGMRDYLLGANAAHVVRHCPRSVLIVRK